MCEKIPLLHKILTKNTSKKLAINCYKGMYENLSLDEQILKQIPHALGNFGYRNTYAYIVQKKT